jgi:CRP/FNR family cyclic AMP-dependent transcriptional regulator
MARNLSSHLERIRAVPLFAQCTSRDLARAAALSTEVSVEAGTVLQREGAPVAQFCIVVDGVATTSVTGRDVDQLLPGAFFGAVGLLERANALASVTASTSTVVRAFGRTEFRALLDTVAPVGLALAGCGRADPHPRPAPVEAIQPARVPVASGTAV